MDTSDKWTAAVALACRAIEASEAPPSLAELARAAGLSAWHFHRIFKRTTGVTPKAYAVEQRAIRLREALAASATVTDALYTAGFNSSGRFYSASGGLLGMAPGAYRDAGSGMQIRFAVGECSLGSILVAATAKGVCAISLGDDPQALMHELERRFAKAELVGADAEFERWVSTIVGHVEGLHAGLDLPLDIRGTAFQQRVWQALREIPAGSTATYAEVAQRIGAPAAVRAVAGACAANTLAVAIPCHRVVRSDGSLSGYRWGVERKRALLDRESRSTESEPVGKAER